MPHDLEELKARVLQFNMIKLPGQPFGMHMGTSYLVTDLLNAVEELTTDSRDLLVLLASENVDSGALFAAADKLNRATGHAIKGLDWPGTEEPR